MPSRIRRAQRVVLAVREEGRRNTAFLRGRPALGRDETRPYDDVYLARLCDYGRRVLDHECHVGHRLAM